MPSGRMLPPLVALGAVLLTGIGVLPEATTSSDAQPASTRPIELRGVWLTNVDSTVLDSRQSIAEAMEFLAAHHFNIVFPVVWNKAATQYPSDVMAATTGVRIDPRFEGRDPLAEVIAEAHKRRIAVMPWFEFGFSSSYKANGGPLIARRPEWAARDREGRLLTKNGFEWMDPFNPEVEQFLASLVAEVVDRYEVDGVQGDDRLPAMPVEGGYSAMARAAYAREHGGAEPPADFRDPAWVKWRAGKLSAIAERIYRDTKRRKPHAIVSWSPSIFSFSLDEYLQDWPAWVHGGYADLVHPQVYRRDIEAYAKALDAQTEQLTPAQQALVFPGVLVKIGPYVASESFVREMVALNRARGYRGEVFFFYEGLRHDNGALAKALLKSHYATPADLPFPVRF